MRSHIHMSLATAVSDEPKLNKYSARITEPKSQGASQAVLYGVGLTDADLRKPQVGVSSVWYEGNTCNMANETPPPEKKKAPLPKVVTLNKALKLAQTWVDKMSASEPDEPNDKDFEGRPSRLGLGAKATPGVKCAAPTNPVERKLLGKVNAQKRKALEDENRTAKEANEASDDDNDEPESRTSAFNKKKTLPSITSTRLGKKAK